MVIIGCQFADLDNDLHGFLHGLDADELVRAVEIDSACEDVGAGEATEGELGTISAATDGLDLGGYAALLHGMHHDVDDVHLGVDLLLHVIVLILQLDGDCAFAVLRIHGVGTAADEALAGFEG